MHQQQQSYQAAGYRGNQPSQYGSQYRGIQQKFQPAGLVQSFYNPQKTRNYGQYQPAQAYHASNYRGNQPGHDNSQRSDSQQSAQASVAGAFARF